MNQVFYALVRFLQSDCSKEKFRVLRIESEGSCRDSPKQKGYQTHAIFTSQETDQFAGDLGIFIAPLAS